MKRAVFLLSIFISVTIYAQKAALKSGGLNGERYRIFISTDVGGYDERWVLGVQPVKPGMSEVLLTCNLCGLSKIKGAVPSPKGVIHMAWNKGKKEISIEVQIPEGLDVEVDLFSEDIKEKKMISLDGQEFAIEKQSNGSFDIPAGKHILKFY